jgi:hypothetical protein
MRELPKLRVAKPLDVKVSEKNPSGPMASTCTDPVTIFKYTPAVVA